MKNKIQEEYLKRTAGSKLTPEEQALMKAELEAKMGSINDLIGAEEANQNKNLEDLLAKRRAKKDKLKGKMEILAEKKQLEDIYWTKM